MKKEKVPEAILMYKLCGHSRWSHEHCSSYKKAMKKKHQLLSDHEGAKCHVYELRDIDQIDLFHKVEEEGLAW